MRSIALLIAILLISGMASAEPVIRYANINVLLDREGNEIISNGVYSDIVSIGGDRYAVRTDGEYAVADANGKVLTDFLYTYLLAENGRIYARSAGEYLILNMNGEQITEGTYAQVIPGQNGMSWARAAGKNALVLISDSGSETVVENIRAAELGDRCGDGLIAVRIENSMLWGYCDADGELIVPAIYSDAGTFQNGRAVIVKDGCCGVIASDGSVIVEARFPILSVTSDLIAGQYEDGSICMMEPDGKVIAEYRAPLCGYALFDSRYAIYSDLAVDIYDRTGKRIESFPAEVHLTGGLCGDILVSNGQWGENAVFLLEFEENLWQDLSPLGYDTNGDPVYRGGVLDTYIRTDTILGEDVVAADPATIQYAIVDACGVALTNVEWNVLEYLCEDRFLAVTNDALRVIDSHGNSLYEIELKENIPNE